MTIYSWVNTTKYAGFLGETAEDERQLRWYDSLMGDPLPELKEWEPPRLRQYLGQGKAKRNPVPLGDSASSALLNLVSRRAVEALDDIWSNSVSLYPVVLADHVETFYMVVSKVQLDCLDEEKSKGKHLDLGTRVVRFASIDEWVFDESCVGLNDIFHLPYSTTMLFVSERFKSRVVAAKLKGFCFMSNAWDPAPFIS
jgi:hypothetical protein